MNWKEVIARYQGRPVETDSLGAYQRFALSYFHRKDKIANPLLGWTMQLDISEARSNYEACFAATKDATLTAFLTWNLMRCLSKHAGFNWREIEGTWFDFQNLPLYFPIAVGGMERFQEVYLENIVRAPWAEFVQRYSEAIQKAREGSLPPVKENYERFHLSPLIGNLPQLQFTSLHPHQFETYLGRPIFYFGRRYEVDGRFRVPLAVWLDHSNTDPFVGAELLEDFQIRIRSTDPS